MRPEETLYSLLLRNTGIDYVWVVNLVGKLFTLPTIHNEGDVQKSPWEIQLLLQHTYKYSRTAEHYVT